MVEDITLQNRQIHEAIISKTKSIQSLKYNLDMQEKQKVILKSDVPVHGLTPILVDIIKTFAYTPQLVHEAAISLHELIAKKKQSIVQLLVDLEIMEKIAFAMESHTSHPLVQGKLSLLVWDIIEHTPSQRTAALKLNIVAL